MKYRMLPLGYMTVNGEIAVNEQEANIVRGIFDEYCNGSTLNGLVNTLNKQEASYIKNGVQWNKGRLHHILVDRRYIGDKSFPQIIDSNKFNTANELKQSKSVKKKHISNEIVYLKGKVVCGNCGAQFKRIYDNGSQERWVCANGCKFGKRPTDESILKAVQQIAEKVFVSPKLLQQSSENSGYKPTTAIMRLTNDIARMNEQNAPSFKTGKTLLFQLASAKFYACKEDKSVYSDFVFEEIKRAIESGCVDVKLIRNTVNKVLIMGRDEYAIKFINGAVITNKEESIDASEISNED